MDILKTELIKKEQTEDNRYENVFRIEIKMKETLVTVKVHVEYIFNIEPNMTKIEVVHPLEGIDKEKIETYILMSYEIEEYLNAYKNELILENETCEVPEINVISVKKHPLWEGSIKSFIAVFELSDGVKREMNIDLFSNGDVDYYTNFKDSWVNHLTKRFDWEWIVVKKAMEHNDFRIRKLLYNVHLNEES